MTSGAGDPNSWEGSAGSFSAMGVSISGWACLLPRPSSVCPDTKYLGFGEVASCSRILHWDKILSKSSHALVCPEHSPLPSILKTLSCAV